jgi:hypothetical protein
MASLGPFDSFAFPDVYTETQNQAPTATAAGELRIPAFIGVGQEQIPVNNYEEIRGSSSMADNPIVRENVSSQITGTNRNFTVSFFPIVDGGGTGTTTNDSKVIVYVNGNSVPIASVDGATGVIYLVNIPASGDEVLCTYYYKKTDTLHTEENLSDQVDGIVTTFRTHYYPIVTGQNGGITSTDPTTIKVKVNGVAVNAVSLDGANGLFTLASAPLAGSVLVVTYYDNELQDTADILPSPYVASIIKVGYAPNTTDFVNGVDYVVDTTGTFSTIQWGASSKIVSGQHTNPSFDYFDSNQVTARLYDNRVYRHQATGTTDGTNKIFTLGFMPVDGQGRGVATEDPTKLGDAAWDSSTARAYFGVSASDGTADHILDIVSTEPEETTATSIQLASAPPAPGVDGTNKVFVTQYMNILQDDVWTLTCQTAGGLGVGVYSVAGQSSGTAYNITFNSASVADSGPFGTKHIEYPTGASADNNSFSDAQVVPGIGSAETVTLTFVDATTYGVSSTNSLGTGSGGDNTGHLNQTYIDKKTGFRVTIMEGTTYDYATNDYIMYDSSSTFPVGSLPMLAIPGVKTTVTTTANIGAGDTAILTTFNKSGAEPNIGDFYYVSFYENKQFDSNGLTKAALYSLEKDVYASTGPLTINNKLGLGSHLAFLNGASALALLQIEKTAGGDDAPDSRYIAGIDYFNEPMTGGVRPNLMEPLTTSIPVLSYLKTSNVIQSGIRYANERYSWFGFKNGTTPTTAQTFARSMLSERMMGIYPDGAITTIPDARGNDVEYLVGGEMMAAAVVGRDVSPAFDVAEPIDKKPIVGFKRLYRTMDAVTAAQTANSGLTLIEEQAAGMDIRFALTTDLTSVLTRTPSVIRTKDFIQRGTRTILRPYIGQKLLSQRISEIEQSLNSYMSALQQASIIRSFQPAKATVDANDPTIIRVVSYYSPVFPLLWIVVEFNIRSST